MLRIDLDIANMYQRSYQCYAGLLENFDMFLVNCTKAQENSGPKQVQPHSGEPQSIELALDCGMCPANMNYEQQTDILVLCCSCCVSCKVVWHANVLLEIFFSTPNRIVLP